MSVWVCGSCVCGRREEEGGVIWFFLNVSLSCNFILVPDLDLSQSESVIHGFVCEKHRSGRNTLELH